MTQGAPPQVISLKSFIWRGIRNFGVPVALFSNTMVFLTTLRQTWRDMLSVAFLFIVVVSILVGTLSGALYGWIMWAIFSKGRAS
jgi:hypothetical protein